MAVLENICVKQHFSWFPQAYCQESTDNVYQEETVVTVVI